MFQRFLSLKSINLPLSLNVLDENCFGGCPELPWQIENQFQLFNF
jgi:hypothetical protein